jgi:hypothetical protein
LALASGLLIARGFSAFPSWLDLAVLVLLLGVLDLFCCFCLFDLDNLLLYMGALRGKCLAALKIVWVCCNAAEGLSGRFEQQRVA